MTSAGPTAWVAGGPAKGSWMTHHCPDAVDDDVIVWALQCCPHGCTCRHNPSAIVTQMMGEAHASGVKHFAMCARAAICLNVCRRKVLFEEVLAKPFWKGGDVEYTDA